jgi:general stress protein YciG
MVQPQNVRNDRIPNLTSNEANLEKNNSKENGVGATAAGSAVPTPRKGSGRGFASMDAAKQREIASKGGKAAHQQGVAHEFTSEEARLAGRKGGEAVSQDTRHMAEIGARGGQKRGLKKKALQDNQS